jgi:hypothetical protein
VGKIKSQSVPHWVHYFVAETMIISFQLIILTEKATGPSHRSDLWLTRVVSLTKYLTPSNLSAVKINHPVYPH